MVSVNATEQTAAFERNTQFPKRAPIGFLGTRGKKVVVQHLRTMLNNNQNGDMEDDIDAADNSLYDGEYKRAPNGFIG